VGAKLVAEGPADQGRPDSPVAFPRRVHINHPPFGSVTQIPSARRSNMAPNDSLGSSLIAPPVKEVPCNATASFLSYDGPMSGARSRRLRAKHILLAFLLPRRPARSPAADPGGLAGLLDDGRAKPRGEALRPQGHAGRVWVATSSSRVAQAPAPCCPQGFRSFQGSFRRRSAC